MQSLWPSAAGELTYADVSWRMLTYADVCRRMQSLWPSAAGELTYADVC
jgi:hypothetical protein